MERISIEQAFAAMYEYGDRYPGCSMFSALPDAPVVDRPGILERVPRALRMRSVRPRRVPATHGGRWGLFFASRP